MLTYTAVAKPAFEPISLTAPMASSSGNPSVPLMTDNTGRAITHSSRPQQPSRPTASKVGTYTVTHTVKKQLLGEGWVCRIMVNCTKCKYERVQLDMYTFCCPAGEACWTTKRTKLCPAGITRYTYCTLNQSSFTHLELYQELFFQYELQCSEHLCHDHQYVPKQGGCCNGGIITSVTP